RKTKVIATIGPACDHPETLSAMIAAGMNVARLNLSHGSFQSHGTRLDQVRKTAASMAANVAVMADTRGREIRTGIVADGAMELERGQDFVLYSDGRTGTGEGVSVSHKALYVHVQRGHRVLLDDGAIELLVTGISNQTVQCRVECGGTLRTNKSVNLPDTPQVADDLESDDEGDLRFAAEHDVDYIAASFIRSGDDIRRLQTQLRALGANIPIIAKIESREGVQNLEEIIVNADGAMVARGDLGVELPLAMGPLIQKRVIRTTVTNGKPVITATQMLDSMERNPRPTRAEASDVANAILDGTSAVMLSGETAVGAYPVQAVSTMVALALEAETGLRDFGSLQQILPNPSNQVTEAVAQAAITMANHLHAATIIALTETGFTARLISKYRPGCPILAVTTSKRVYRRLAMNWGVYGFRYPEEGTDQDKIAYATRHAKRVGLLRTGDLVIATAGSSHTAGSTDLIRVLSVD
ncbi:MAG: pyruvate kinase, partial [Gammaproteobacteria bacterium]|nr:pyruvate kinase [Gammaproteobacteria bacterium]